MFLCFNLQVYLEELWIQGSRGTHEDKKVVSYA